MKSYFSFILTLVFLSSCVKNSIEDGKIHVVTTTTIVTDIVKNIGGEKVEVIGLMGAGVDPHLYKASEGDVTKLANAQMIIYGGLHLEGKLVDVFKRIEKQNKIQIDLGASIPTSELHVSDEFDGIYDPHVWFNVRLIMHEVKAVADALSNFSPEDTAYFQENLAIYLEKLEKLDQDIRELVSTLPKEKRKLVTAHDAFGYFGREYDFEVIGIQGISTASEAGVQNMRTTTDYIVRNNIRSIFIESSVPQRTVDALIQAVLSKKHKVQIGGMLYSDALGNPDSEEGTYIGMMLYNVQTIVNGLK